MNLFNIPIPASSSDIANSTSWVTGISEAIKEYGIIIVCIAIFLLITTVLFFLAIKLIGKSLENTINGKDKDNEAERKAKSDILDVAIEKFKNDEANNLSNMAKSIEDLTTVVKDLKKSFDNRFIEEKKKDYHQDIVGSYIDINGVFEEAGSKAMGRIGCERIAIYVFHNGNASYHGLPFFKMSCVYERYPNEINIKRGKSHYDLPLNFYYDIISKIWKNGTYYVDDIIKENSRSLTDFVVYSKTKALYMKAVKDSKNSIAGFVVAEFNNEEEFSSNIDRRNFMEDSLGEMIDSINPILTSKYVYNKK